MNKQRALMNRGKRPRFSFFLWLVALIFSWPGKGFCQVGRIDAEFAGAGARPLSMGGAFIGLADDSTAAEFNPAGIRILRRPELAWQVTRTYDRREEYLPLTSFDRNRIVFTPDSNQWTTPSFISYVHPGQKFTWAVSQLTTIDFVHRFDDPTVTEAGRPFVNRTAVRNNAVGLTLAGDLLPRLHFGVTLRMNRFWFRNENPFFDPTVLEFSDWSPNVNVGLLWRVTKNWSFGTVFKSSQQIRENLLGQAVSFKIPETVGVGAAYHPNDRFRLLADVDYINWSVFDSDDSDEFRRNDVTRYHVGGEYLFSLTEKRAWFVRAGFMREDSNALYYKGRFSSLGEAFPEKDPIDHLTFGIGLAKEKYQLDLGVDHALDGGTTLILAMIHYF